ncbi:MAG: bifunctional nuclease family protein [Chlamydiales bacterium]|nr:bifunctional nuclease family protein [Chlamydiales bacterium]
MSELMPIKCYKVLQTRSYTVVTLGNQEKKFAIYTEPSIGKTMQMHLTETENPRPLTHDLMNMVFSGFGIKVKKVIINDVQETVYFARIFLEQEFEGKTSIVEIDARPSDCLTLALIQDIPVYCTSEVMKKAVAVEE